jgi:hypothetical protein
LPVFDYGYYIESLRQVSVTEGPQEINSAVSGLDEYSLVQEALRMRGGDPGMEFAAALVTLWPKRAEHEEHFRKAVAGADRDPLLAKNMLIQFSYRGSSLAQLRAASAQR